MPHLLLCVNFGELLLLGSIQWLAVSKAARAQPAQPTPNAAALKTEGLPIAFEPNLKQADARYKFLVHQNGLAMGFLDHSLEVRLATKAGSADVAWHQL